MVNLGLIDVYDGWCSAASMWLGWGQQIDKHQYEVKMIDMPIEHDSDLESALMIIHCFEA